MTVKEAIEELKKYDESMEVKIFCGSTNENVVEIFEDIEDECPVFSN